jgi:hypothetical protein
MHMSSSAPASQPWVYIHTQVYTHTHTHPCTHIHAHIHPQTSMYLHSSTHTIICAQVVEQLDRARAQAVQAELAELKAEKLHTFDGGGVYPEGTELLEVPRQVGRQIVCALSNNDHYCTCCKAAALLNLHALQPACRIWEEKRYIHWMYSAAKHNEQCLGMQQSLLPLGYHSPLPWNLFLPPLP